MRQVTIGFSLIAMLLSLTEPAASKEGVPGRRVGGGTRWTNSNFKQAPSLQSKLSAMSFASRNALPMRLKLKVLYG
jgi:hypothetical protein